MDTLVAGSGGGYQEKRDSEWAVLTTLGMGWGELCSKYKSEVGAAVVSQKVGCEKFLSIKQNTQELHFALILILLNISKSKE